jgi:hypothetical protein
MKDFRRTLILGATLLVAGTGVALAEQTEPSQAPQQTSFWSWLFPSATPAVAPKSRPSTGRLVSAPEPAKPRPSCKLLTCITLVGIGL